MVSRLGQRKAKAILILILILMIDDMMTSVAVSSRNRQHQYIVAWEAVRLLVSDVVFRLS